MARTGRLWIPVLVLMLVGTACSESSALTEAEEAWCLQNVYEVGGMAAALDVEARSVGSPGWNQACGEAFRLAHGGVPTTEKGEGLLGEAQSLGGQLAALGGSIEGNAGFVSLTIPAASLQYVEDQLEALVDRLGLEPGTYQRMLLTRAIDGTQEAAGDGVRATWSFHPDSGLRIVISATDY